MFQAHPPIGLDVIAGNSYEVSLELESFSIAGDGDAEEVGTERRWEGETSPHPPIHPSTHLLDMRP